MGFKFVRLVVLLAVFTGFAGAAFSADKGPYLAGRLLVAAKKLSDPNFIHTVVYLVEHDADGAIGLIINRRIGDGNLADLLKAFDLNTDKIKRRVPLHFGGPVATGSVFVLHSLDYEGEGTLKAANGLAMTGNRAILTAISEGRGPARMRFMIGYSGWGPGQLENEIARGDWLDAAAEPDVIFDEQGSAEEQWNKARDKAGLTL